MKDKKKERHLTLQDLVKDSGSQSLDSINRAKAPQNETFLTDVQHRVTRVPSIDPITFHRPPNQIAFLSSNALFI